MLTETQDDLYFSRMKSALGDKISIIDHLTSGTILDVGAGGGELAEAMRRTTGECVIALDGSRIAIQRIKNNFPDLVTLLCNVDSMEKYLTTGSLGNIVCSSILHEVFSYGGYRESKIKDALGSFNTLLRTGGKLIIRDGVIPDNWEQEVTVHFSDPDGARLFMKRYAQIAPFWGRLVYLEEQDSGVYFGNMRSAMEFLYTYTWGWGSVEREAHEMYGVFTESEYCEHLDAAGFDVEYSSAYLQPGYPHFLAPKAQIMDRNGVILPFPPSNMILAASKR